MTSQEQWTVNQVGSTVEQRDGARHQRLPITVYVQIGMDPHPLSDAEYAAELRRAAEHVAELLNAGQAVGR